MATKSNCNITSIIIDCIKDILHCVPVIIFNQKGTWPGYQTVNRKKKQIVNSATSRVKIANVKKSPNIDKLVLLNQAQHSH